MQLTLTAQCICSAGTRRSGLFVVGRIDVSLDMTRTPRQAASRAAHVSKGEHATCSSRGSCFAAFLLPKPCWAAQQTRCYLQLTLTLSSVWSETTLCPPSPEILSYHRQITSHLRKQGTLSINHRLHRPQPYWAVHTSAKASSSTPPASHRRLHGLGEHSSAADIHLGSRLIGLCLLYRQRMH